MPEAVVPVRSLIRLRSEACGPVEVVLSLKPITADQITKIISEIMNLVERDDFRYMWSWALQERTNIAETELRILGASISILVEIVDESVSFVETKSFKLTQTITDIVKIIEETVSIVEEQVRARTRVFIRTDLMQLRETRVPRPETLITKVIDEALNYIEHRVYYLESGIVLELVKVISEGLNTVETFVTPRERTKIRSEQVTIEENAPLNIVFIIGQLSGLFRIQALLRGIFRINQDVEQ